MSNRGRVILSLFLALAGRPVFAQGPAVLVHLYDDAGLKPKAFRDLASRTQAILVHAGLSVQVVACPKEGLPCQGVEGNPHELMVRVMGGEAGSMKNVLHPPLGQSVTDAGGGTYASVFLPQVRLVANDVGVPWITVLSYAVVHEIGHLLLGSDSHTPEGVMKANWKANDLLAMDQSRLYFDRQQARQLASRFGPGRHSEAGETLLARQ